MISFVRPFLTLSVQILLAIGAYPNRAVAQRPLITVAVDLTDTKAGGVLTSVFKAAFRALGDVDVVSESENPKFRITGTILCEPNDCKGVSRYSVAFTLQEPFTVFDIYGILSEARQTTSDSVVRRLAGLYSKYSVTHDQWVGDWGHERYEATIRQIVSEIDAQCFEKRRIMSRLAALPPAKERSDVWEREILSKTWMC